MSEWGKVPKEAFTDGRLTRGDVRVLGILCAHANGRTGLCTRKQGTIAEEIGVSRETVNRSLQKLARLGYVQPRQRPGMKRSLDYRVLVSDGTSGQLGLFDTDAAPRQAKARPGKPAAKRDRPVTSVVMSEITSAVTSDVTAKEQTLVNRGPAGPAAQRASGISVDHRDDHRQQGAAPADLDATSNVVPLRLPDAVPLRAGADLDGSALARRLTDAAGAAINSASPAFLNLAEPYGWLAAGCDLDADIVPTVTGLAARHSGPPVRSWRYFTDAVIEARDRRCNATTRGTAPAQQRPARMKSVGSRLADAMGRIARGEEAFPLHDERTIDVAARR